MIKIRTKRPWYSDGLQFQCTMCGNCCSGPEGEVRVSPGESRRIAESLELPIEEFTEIFTETSKDGSGRVLKMKPTPDSEESEDCIFLDRESMPGRAVCRVHGSKPRQCQAWPFWPVSLQTPESWEAAGKVCPGVSKGGRVYSRKEIDRIRDSMKVLEDSIGTFEHGWC